MKKDINKMYRMLDIHQDEINRIRHVVKINEILLTNAIELIELE